MMKINCITKEKYEKMYKTTEDNAEREDLSVGEDLETFIGEIKKDGLIGALKVEKINSDLVTDSYKIRTRIPPMLKIPRDLFLLCLLDKEQRKKLEQKDEEYMQTFNLHTSGRADVSEAEWNESESNMKFSLSFCRRKTYFIEV